MKNFNPIQFAHEVNTKFLNYQLTAFPISDPELGEQAKQLLKGELDFLPLIKGPYVSISKSFAWGKNLKDLAKQNKIHPALPGLTDFHQMFLHQDKALEAIQNNNHCLVSTGTGSGKTESFLYPILDYCLKLRDSGAPEGLTAILVYPMNALAIDQLNRLRKMLVGSGISFGLYIGTTAATEGQANVHKMAPGEGKKEFEELTARNAKNPQFQISPPEERLSEEDITNRPPRILLTNVKQLELLMTRAKDVKIFLNAPLKFLVFDEAHTYSGVAGAEVSCLIRRLRTLTGKNADEVTCIGTSATIVDPELGPDAGKYFMERFFGIDKKRISIIEEEYEEEDFPKERYNPLFNNPKPIELLNKILQALDTNDKNILKECYEELTGKGLQLKADDIYEDLYNELKSSNYVYYIFKYLKRPVPISEAIGNFSGYLKRNESVKRESAIPELLCYLALGAAAQRGGNPLIRPKLHYFVKGLDGAVIAFTKSADNKLKPKLFLSQSMASQTLAYDLKAYLPVFVCKTCGQHYFEGYYLNLIFNGDNLKDGQAEGDNVIWEPTNDVEGNRVLLTDRFVSEIDDEEGLVEERLDEKRTEIYFCHYCGCLQKNHSKECSNPKCKRINTLVKLWLVNTNAEGKLMACPSCKTRARSFGGIIEPIRPLRAIAVSDVHILAQNMINEVDEDNRKLLVFADNRQDAAFQSGWMQDHARRYRLRHLIFEYLSANKFPVSIGDIVAYLSNKLNEDKNLAIFIAPEVCEYYADESFGTTFQNQLKYYLRIQILRELGTSFNQKEGLESWGILRIDYHGVNIENSWIKEWAEKTKLQPSEFVNGISTILDIYRRNRYLYDSSATIYSRFWREGDTEIQNGYLPFITGAGNKPVPPKGLIENPDGAKNLYKVYFRSLRGKTLVEQLVSKWGVNDKLKDDFLKSLWKFLTDQTNLLVPVNFTSSGGREIDGARSIYQLDASRVGLVAQWSKYKCGVCQRIHARNTPNNACTTMYCNGNLSLKEPSDDDYNIGMIKGSFSMLMPHEHTAQVPPDTREKIEREFKKVKGRYNCLVATPTLELGVDIGALDMILMRNVPPTPSNYWQRAGRAGRRQRIAVIYSYCRRSDHDQYFFEDPQQMLEGDIECPRFNLKNEIMIRKHVHAAVISSVLKILRTRKATHQLDEDQLNEIKEQFYNVFPTFIRDYLFEHDGHYKTEIFDVTPLQNLISKHQEFFISQVSDIFQQYWPIEDIDALSPELIKDYIFEMPALLRNVLTLLYTRMVWALNTQTRLLDQQRQQLLEPEDEKVLNRCKNFIKGLSHTSRDNYTLSVLSEEGFLPGYGLYNSGIKAFAHQQFIGGRNSKPDFDLSRNNTVAVREFVPGNMIYANGGRFRSVLYHLSFMGGTQIRDFKVNVSKKFFIENTADLDVDYNDQNLIPISSIPICDSDIQYISRINDEESNRFQMPVAIFGKLRKSRRGGKSYTISDKTIQYLIGQQIVLLNIGPADLAKIPDLGYPVCRVCGATRSPYASEREIEHFQTFHRDHCGTAPLKIALFAEDKVDGILLQGFGDEIEAINLGEGIVMGGSFTLEMDRGDLNLLTFPSDDDTYNLFIYDPMPGGSGLLNQMMNKWPIVIEAGINALNNCPNQCENSCYSCMRTYYNAYNHEKFDRDLAVDLLKAYQESPVFQFDIQPEEENRLTDSGESTNKGENMLDEIITGAGLPQFEKQKEIDIGPPYRRTIPDLFYEDSIKNIRIAVYLDGLSKNIHGNDDRRRADLFIRNQLENMGIIVIEIAHSDLNDPVIMDIHLKKIAGVLR